MTDDDSAFRSNEALKKLVKEAQAEGLNDWECGLLADLNEFRRPGTPPITRAGLVKSVVFLVQVNRTWGFVDRKAWMGGAVIVSMIFGVMAMNSIQDIIKVVRKAMGL